mgnify:FL=1
MTRQEKLSRDIAYVRGVFDKVLPIAKKRAKNEPGNIAIPGLPGKAIPVTSTGKYWMVDPWWYKMAGLGTTTITAGSTVVYAKSVGSFKDFV